MRHVGSGSLLATVTMTMLPSRACAATSDFVEPVTRDAAAFGDQLVAAVARHRDHTGDAHAVPLRGHARDRLQSGRVVPVADSILAEVILLDIGEDSHIRPVVTE